jgi:hypothetical protein
MKINKPCMACVYRPPRQVLPGVCWLLLLLVAGCGRNGQEVVPVKGTITYGGGSWPKPGFLHFAAESSGFNTPNHPAVGEFDTDGRLTVTTFRSGDGLIPGKYRIRVVSWETPPSKTELTFPKNYVPARFQAAASSGLSVTVEPGQKVVTLNLDVPKK